MKREGDETVLTTREARSAERTGVLPILLASLSLACIVGVVLYMAFFGLG